MSTFDVEQLRTLTRLVGPFEPGTVSLVGAGPGDSALISVRGAIRLAQADAVLYDKLVGPELLRLPRPETERIFVGKWRGEHRWTQDGINDEMVRRAGLGQRVVRLKGGDPFVFGRGGEECAHLAAAGVRYEVVPGVTAAFGAPAMAGIPLTHRGISRSFALVTGHAEPDDDEPLPFEALARMETVALYMGLKNLAFNCERLIAGGLDPRTPAAVIHQGTRPDQRTIIGTAADIADRVAAANIEPPTMILIGQVVTMRESIEWFESRPLHGQVVAVTRAADQAASLCGALRAAGAEVIEAPTIETRPLADYTSVDLALRSVQRYQWLVLTSANGVTAMMDRLAAIGSDTRQLGGVKIAAVGSGTANALREYRLEPDLIPPEAVGEALAEALIKKGIKHQRILLLRAEIARADLPDALREAGSECDDLPIYFTSAPPHLPESFRHRLKRGEIDWITLTSPSTFKNLLALIPSELIESLRRVKLASIGPVTTRAIREADFHEEIEADPHDVTGLVATMITAARRHHQDRET